jgi:hypothetical protein
MNEMPGWDKERLALFCAQHQDVDQGGEIINYLNEQPRSLATILSAFAYILAELESQVPQAGLMMPTLELMMQRCLATFDHPEMERLRHPAGTVRH